MKKMLCLLLILLLLPIYGVSADEMYTVVPKDITVTYNGDPVEFPDALPLIQNGKTLVPMRPIMERANLIVDFDGESRTVTAKNDNLFIVMKIDDTIATISDGETTRKFILDEPARIIKNRTYVPVRFVAESLGTKVNWNPYAREVVIIDTDEWKAELSEKSDFLGDFIDLPLTAQTPFSRNISGEYHYSCDAKSLITTEGTVSVKADRAFSFVGTGVFDGTNTGYFISVETDLSNLAPFFGDSLTNEEAAKLSGDCIIDLDVVIDPQQNLYVKSQFIKQLLTNLGRSETVEKLGDNYIKIPAAERYQEQELNALVSAAAKGESRWDLFEDLIREDDMIYTQSVLLIDSKLSGYGDLYNNLSAKISVPSKGAKQWDFTSGETAHGVTALTLAKMMSTGTNFPVKPSVLTAQSENLDDASVKTNLSITVKDNMVTRSRISMTLKSPASAKNQVNFSINFGSSSRKFDEKTDQPITLPEQVILQSELKSSAQ